MAVSRTKNDAGLQYTTKEAEGTLVANTFVKPGTAEPQVVTAGAGEVAIGVVEAGYSDGENAKVVIGGQAMLKLGGTVSETTQIKSDANGYGVATSAGDQAFAEALADGVSGDVIPVKVLRVGTTQ